MSRILVISAGAGHPSSSRLLGERLAEAAGRLLPEAEVTQLELRTIAVDLAQHLASRVPNARLRDAFDQVARADGVIAVSPVINGSYSGLFKLFFDAVDEGVLRGRPVLLGAVGGTARHSLVIEHALLPLFYYLKALVAPHPVFAATKDWGAGAKLEHRIEVAASAFVELVRQAGPANPPDEFAVPDFSELLGGSQP